MYLLNKLWLCLVLLQKYIVISMYLSVPKGYEGLLTKSRHITGKAQHIAYSCEISSVKT